MFAMLPLCCITSQHMAAPRVVVAHPVCLKAKPLPAGSWQLPAPCIPTRICSLKRLAEKPALNCLDCRRLFANDGSEVPLSLEEGVGGVGIATAAAMGVA